MVRAYFEPPDAGLTVVDRECSTERGTAVKINVKASITVRQVLQPKSTGSEFVGEPRVHDVSEIPEVCKELPVPPCSIFGILALLDDQGLPQRHGQMERTSNSPQVRYCRIFANS